MRGCARNAAPGSVDFKAFEIRNRKDWYTAGRSGRSSYPPPRARRPSHNSGGSACPNRTSAASGAAVGVKDSLKRCFQSNQTRERSCVLALAPLQCRCTHRAAASDSRSCLRSSRCFLASSSNASLLRHQPKTACGKPAGANWLCARRCAVAIIAQSHCLNPGPPPEEVGCRAQVPVAPRRSTGDGRSIQSQRQPHAVTSPWRQ